MSQGISIETIPSIPFGSISARAAQFERVFAANRAALTRLAPSYTRTVADRDDPLREIGIALWRALPRFRGDCSERTYLFRIAHDRCITHVARRCDSVSLDEAGDDGPCMPTSAPAEAEAAGDQERHRLFEAVRRLPPIYREITVLVVEGMTYQQIADVVGISETNVRVRLNRARRKAGSLWIAQGTGRPLGETTAAYVDLSIRRCRSSIGAGKFGAVLYVVQFLFVLIWKLRFSSLGVIEVLTAWPVGLLGWIGFPLFLIWLGWYLGVKRAELAALLALREEIEGAE